VAALAATTVALTYASSADATDYQYCEYIGENVNANDWCWQGHPPESHNFDANSALYNGSGSFQYCAALKYPNGEHVAGSPNCTTPNQSFFVIATFCNTGAGTALKAAVGNRDNSAHSIYALARVISGC
jgi:hypothetical protein